MKTVRTSETSVYFDTTRLYIPERCNLVHVCLCPFFRPKLLSCHVLGTLLTTISGMDEQIFIKFCRYFRRSVSWTDMNGPIKWAMLALKRRGHLKANCWTINTFNGTSCIFALRTIKVFNYHLYRLETCDLFYLRQNSEIVNQFNTWEYSLEGHRVFKNIIKIYFETFML
jgi:hypothetical protein